MAELHTDVRYLRGVGEARAKSLQKLGITDLESLVSYLPRAYEDRRGEKRIADLIPGETACVRALVASAPKLSRIRKGLDLVKLRVACYIAIFAIWIVCDKDINLLVCFYPARAGSRNFYFANAFHRSISCYTNIGFYNIRIIKKVRTNNQCNHYCKYHRYSPTNYPRWNFAHNLLHFIAVHGNVYLLLFRSIYFFIVYFVHGVCVYVYCPNSN